MSTEKQTQEMVTGTTSWLLGIVKKHGLATALMLAGLYVYDDKLEKAEVRITALEEKLYGCYEKHINAGTYPHTTENPMLGTVFVLPSSSKKKYVLIKKQKA